MPDTPTTPDGDWAAIVARAHAICDAYNLGLALGATQATPPVDDDDNELVRVFDTAVWDHCNEQQVSGDCCARAGLQAVAPLIAARLGAAEGHTP